MSKAHTKMSEKVAIFEVWGQKKSKLYPDDGSDGYPKINIRVIMIQLYHEDIVILWIWTN